VPVIPRSNTKVIMLNRPLGSGWVKKFGPMYISGLYRHADDAAVYDGSMRQKWAD